MKVTQVTVTVHEKRNHPHEFGHYDCSVALTAEVGAELEAHDAIALLRAKARVQVLEECANWETNVRREGRIAKLVRELESELANIRRWVSQESLQDRMCACLDIIRCLPEDDRGKWKDGLAEAMGKARERTGNVIDGEDNLPF